MAKAQLHSKAPTDEKSNKTGKTQKSLEQEPLAESPSQQPAVNPLHKPTPSSMQVLQRTIGNRAVQSLVEKKPQGANDSTVIQRHVGSFAEPTAIATNSLLTATADSMGAVQSAQGMFQAYRSMAASTPIPTSEERNPDRGGEGHGYEFDDDVVE